MSRHRWLALFAMLTVAVGLGTAAADSAPAEDPFPIRRVRITEDQLPDAMKQFDGGPVVRLPRADFETRVRAAGHAVSTARDVPRLTRAAYVAELTPEDDLTGTAEWEIVNPSSRESAFSLDPPRLVLHAPRWADGRAAAIGVLGSGFPTTPSLWVEGRRLQTLRFSWSAAGTPGPGERRFELRAPTCPSAVLDLTLPANRTPIPDAFLAGPFDVAGRPDLRAWRFRFGDRTKLEFTVRGPGSPAAVQSARAKLTAKYDFALGHVTCAFEYDLTSTRGSVGEWLFALDPAIRVTDAVVFNRAGWSVEGPSRDRRLRVRLRQPGTGGKVLITGEAPFTLGPLPMIRPIDAVVGEERLEVRVSPELKLNGCHAGDYRPLDGSGGFDQPRVLILGGSLAADGAETRYRRAPAVWTSPNDTDFTTREGVEWRVENGREVLVARLAIRVRRGPMFGLAVQTPPGFERVRVMAGSDDLIDYVGDTSNPGGLAVDFVQPLTSGQHANLRIELRGPPLSSQVGKPVRVPFPRIVPLGAA